MPFPFPSFIHFAKHRTRNSGTIRRALLPPLAALTVLVALLLFQVVSLLRVVRSIDDSDRVIAQADETLRLVIDMETGERGYLVGRDTRFLDPYHIAARETPNSFDQLDRQLADNPPQRIRAAAMRQKFLLWQREALREMAERSAGGSAYVSYFNRGRGKRLMDRVRGQAADLVESERRIRDAQRLKVQAGTELVLGATALSVLLVGGLLTLTTRRAVFALSRQFDTTLDAEQEVAGYLAATLTSIGDAVLVTDGDGRITLLNQVAEELTGWTQADALGKESRVVFDLVDEHTGVAVENPIGPVLREGETMGLAKHRVLRRKDRNLLAIDDSASPIRDSRGIVTGAILVFRDVSERKRIETERAEVAAKVSRIAEALQQSLLLTPSLNSFTGLRIATVYEAAGDEARVGGDFFDSFAIDDRTVAVVVGDVTGKGLAAAAFTAESKFALRTILRECPEPATALVRLNKFVNDSRRLDSRRESALISLSVAVIDTESGNTEVACGGAEAPMIARLASGAIETVDAGGPLIGMDPDSDYSAVSCRLEPGDLMIMTTDGITEARSGRSFFGPEGVAAVLATCDRTDPDHVAASILEGAKTFSSNHIGDDICLIVAQRQPDK